MAINFDERAREWDSKASNLERSENIGAEILKQLPDTREMRGVEYGCGTGLLGFKVLPHFKEMTFCDTSAGMMEVVEEKIRKGKHENCRAVLLDPAKPGDTREKYDCILNLMLLHHIEDTERAIGEWSESLSEGGYLCIGDLMPEDGSFHIMEFHGHLGFDPEELAGIAERKGLVVESITTPHVERRNDREYPVFLLVARKV